jgi:glutamine amidotransferase
MLDVIDYGGGNVGSLTRALERLDLPYRLVADGATLTGANPVVLPGVGSFGGVMAGLRDRGHDGALKRAISAGTPFLGICVGLQILFERSEESPGVEGLSILPGEVVRFREGKVPQIGWNRIEPRQGPGFEAGFVYFVNSYFPRPARPEDVLYEADYHGPFCAAVRRGNVLAFQFHPEKSGAFGHALLRRCLAP